MWLFVFLYQPQLFLMSFNDFPLSLCCRLKGIQLQSNKNVAAIPKRICPNSTPTTSIVVNDSCPIEGSYKFYLEKICFIISISSEFMRTVVSQFYFYIDFSNVADHFYLYVRLPTINQIYNSVTLLYINYFILNDSRSRKV